VHRTYPNKEYIPFDKDEFVKAVIINEGHGFTGTLFKEAKYLIIIEDILYITKVHQQVMA